LDSVVYLSIAKAVAFFITFRQVQSNNDIMYDEAPLFYFSVPEALYAVFSACLPTLRPVMRRWRVPLTTNANSYYDQYGRSRTVTSEFTAIQGTVELNSRSGVGNSHGKTRSAPQPSGHSRGWASRRDPESALDLDPELESVAEHKVVEPSEKMSAASSAAGEDDRQPLRNHIASQLSPVRRPEQAYLNLRAASPALRP
jgi:hypothetical protein